MLLPLRESRPTYERKASLNPLNTRSKADRVYRRLLARIRKGEYNFGEKLSTVAISKELGVSRQPVMAAIMLLQAEGLLHVTPQVGCNIVTPSAREILDFFELFAVSEGLLARFAATRGAADALSQLRAAEERLSAVPYVGKLSHTYGTYARRFHGVIHQMSGAPELRVRVESLWGLGDFYLNTAKSGVRAEDVQAEHDERRLIVDTIAKKHADEAEESMRAHIRRKLYRIGPGRDLGELPSSDRDDPGK